MARIEYSEPIVIVGGGSISPDQFQQYNSLPKIAVDGGANWLHDHGFDFDYLLGDFDSVRNEIIESLDRDSVICLEDQNYTDLHKALMQVSAPHITGFGFLGPRLDHSLEALRLLALFSRRSLDLVGTFDRAFVWQSGFPYHFSRESRISFVSLGMCEISDSEGLQYSLAETTIHQSLYSISNVVSHDHVVINYEGAPLIALLAI